ncbi:preprotein translocase subunit YajC [bacterium BMS3Abin02]|nr:preprotein translocase subunit YajC [bacterium BMS3Abin02]GBE21053.1 preprotein translocase subunit YajC [bacterium BMS3Bbin01]HDH24728.1 preprotein translocase subunit YajC [Actinomycetota bacterium]HDL48368.1 preprotein translocase subunit YajC [Actinomycetota bacterium]
MTAARSARAALTKKVDVLVLAQTQDAGGSSWTSLIFLALLIGLFYVLLIRPQRVRAKKQREVAASLEIGDKVQSYGGVFGVVISLDEDSVVLGLEEGRMRISRRAIAGKRES